MNSSRYQTAPITSSFAKQNTNQLRIKPAFCRKSVVVMFFFIIPILHPVAKIHRDLQSLLLVILVLGYCLGSETHSLFSYRTPILSYYIIVTDTKETEQNFMYGLRDSLPQEMQRKLVIKVIKTGTNNLVDEALNQAALHPQYGEIWIIFDRDQVQNFDKIICSAKNRDINVGWTNPCIEAWFNAYFGSMPTYTDSVSCCSGFSNIFKKMTGQKYIKSDKNIYKKLITYGDEEKAIKIAELKLKEHDRRKNNLPSKMLPCTTLHCLVKEIKSKTTK